MSDENIIVIQQQVTQLVNIVAAGPQGIPGTTEMLNTVNQWNKQQYHPLSTLTINGDNTIDWNWDTQPQAKLHLNGPAFYFLNIPTNRQPGVRTLRVYQNSIGFGIILPNPAFIIDLNLSAVTFAANSFLDLYFKDDGTYIVVSGSEYLP